MTYEDALRFWFGRINYEVRSAHPADLKLERMRALLHRLGDPQDRVRIVHVTGTKGKGSTSAMLASILREAGFRVGLFTSPHLVDVRERMQVNVAGRDLAVFHVGDDFYALLNRCPHQGGPICLGELLQPVK